MNLDNKNNNANFTCTGCADIFSISSFFPPYKKRKWGIFPAPLLPFIIIVVRWKNLPILYLTIFKNRISIKDPFEQYNLLNRQRV